MIVQNTTFTTVFVRIVRFQTCTFHVEEAEKKICWSPQQGTVQGYFSVIIRIKILMLTTMIVQNTTFTAAFVRIVRFGTCTLHVGEAEKKNCWGAQQGTVQGHFRVIIGIKLLMMTTMIVQNTTFTFVFVRNVRFGTCTFPLERQKKNICWGA